MYVIYILYMLFIHDMSRHYSVYTLYVCVLYMSIHYIALYQSRYYMMSMHCVYMLYVYTFVYTIYTLWSLYNIYVCYMAIYYMYLYNTYVYTLYKYMWYLYTYMCLYTLELGKQTDPWRLLASLANQWTPGSVKDTRKSDREGLLTLTSGLHTYTQIWKQHTSSCHTHKPALLGAVKVMSWLWEF